MSLFSKPQFILWPKDKTLEIYSDKKENNSVSFDLDLTKKMGPQELQPLVFYLRKNKIRNCHLLVPDEIALIRSFIYDSKIKVIEKKEVISLAESFTPFDINPQYLDYQLINTTSQTVIRTTIFNQEKIKALFDNLARINLKISTIKPVSSAITRLINTFFSHEYFLLYPLETGQYTLVLAKGEDVYLTAGVKGTPLDIQKIINYSKLYFSSSVKKFFLPHDQKLDIICSTPLEKTPFNSTQIAQNFSKPANLPLPVIGIMLFPKSSNPDIIKQMNQDNQANSNTNSASSFPSEKKNILPIIAVFIFTAAIASVVIWFVLNRSPSSSDNQAPEAIPTSAPEPTSTPVPTITEIDKDLKIQVLNATDINGQAASLKKSLASLGFTNITVGNTKESASSNQVQLKVSTDASISAYFKNKLAEIFPATYESSLKDNSTYDLVFIIGADLRTTGQTTPTTKVTVTPDEASPTVEPSPQE